MHPAHRAPGGNSPAALFCRPSTVLKLSARQRWAIGKGGLTLYGRINNASEEHYFGSVIVNQASSQFYESGLPNNCSVGLSLSAPL